MRVNEFEDRVWDIDGIRIVIRAAEGTVVDDYDWQNAAQETWRVTQWLDSRITPRVGTHQVVVVQGDGEQPHGRVILRTLRQTYR